LQLYKGDQFLDYSIENRIRSVVVPAPRGMIYDREGRLLVDNMPSFDATLTPQYIPRDKKEYVLSSVSDILNIPKEEIAQKLIKARHQAKFLPVVIKEDITRDELARVEVNRLRISGLDIKVAIRRTYLHGEAASHLLGYIGEISAAGLKRAREKYGMNYKQGDLTGKSGVELVLEKHLRGLDGVNYFEVDARGRKRSRGGGELFGSLTSEEAEPGNNVILTIDMDLQRVAEDSFKEGEAGSAAAIDLRTGEMLAIVSKPSFDPTLFSRGIDEENYKKLINDSKKPLRNKLVQDHYPPGSTFKVVVALAGLAEGVITKETKVKCPGWFRLGRRKYRCWRRYGHGVVAIHRAIVESCDTFFWWLGNKLGIDTIAKYAKILGLGKLTGIGLPEEKTGLVPSSEWKLKTLKEEWIRGETLSAAIGQGFDLVTPMQLLKLYSIIANDGIVYKPYFVKRIEAPSGKILHVNEPVIEGNVMFPPEYFKIIKEGLYGVVQERRGTARWTRVPGIDAAGKTGTSQVIRMEKQPVKCEEQKYDYRDHAFFVGFAPVDDPEIAAVAMVEHGCHGSTAAAPIVRNIIHAYYKKYKGLKKRLYTKRQKQIVLAEARKNKKEKEKEKEKDKDKDKDKDNIVQKEEA